MSSDVGSDAGPERGDSAIDAAADFALGDEGKEALDLIEPGRACGRRDGRASAAFWPANYGSAGLVCGVIVHDEMNLEFLGDVGFDLVEELAELGRPMAAIALCRSRGQSRCRGRQKAR